jgi:hypothetical protein
VFCGGLRCEILKKIRKKAKFEVLIFYYKSRRKMRSRELLDRSSYIKSIISENKANFESYFLQHERKSKDYVEFRCLWCIEPGRKVYLERQFFYNYRFSNLDDFYTLQKWFDKQESVLHIYNQELMNRNVEYYRNLRKYKFDLINTEGNIFRKIEKLKNFKLDIDEFKGRIEKQKRSLLKFKDDLYGKSLKLNSYNESIPNPVNIKSQDD